MNKSIPLIYILSTGRSGSTLLELLLNAHQNLSTIGEFHVLPAHLSEPSTTCACGQAYETCPQWGKIVQENYSKITDSTLGRYRTTIHTEDIFNWQELINIFFASDLSADKVDKHYQRYSKDNLYILEKVKKKIESGSQGKSVGLIDASKNMYRLFALGRSNDFAIKVIYLVRDPRGYVCSMGTGNNRFSTLHAVIRYSIRWLIQNYFFTRLLKKHFLPEDVFRLKYEHFASDSSKTLQQLLDWLDLPHDESIVGNFRQTNHGIAGNPRRKENKPISLDERWRKTLSPIHKRLIWLIAGRMARGLGYSKH